MPVPLSHSRPEDLEEVRERLEAANPKRGTALSVGVFDGVHQGHVFLLERLKGKASERDLVPGVITFLVHPRNVLHPERKLPCLSSREERLRLLRRRVDLVVELPFTKKLADLRARDFVKMLREHLDLKMLVMGPDFALGRGREGDASFLRKLGEELGFEVEVVPPLVIRGRRVSSSAIREALSSGDIETANAMLGRSYSLEGVVVRGASRGRVLGFPTANIAPDPQKLLPARGVYAALAFVNQRFYKAAVNIGIRPTFESSEEITIEAFLIGFEGELYGAECKLHFVKRLREERRFPSAEELISQIRRDVERASEILAGEEIEDEGS